MVHTAAIMPLEFCNKTPADLWPQQTKYFLPLRGKTPPYLCDRDEVLVQDVGRLEVLLPESGAAVASGDVEHHEHEDETVGGRSEIVLPENQHAFFLIQIVLVELSKNHIYINKYTIIICGTLIHTVHTESTKTESHIGNIQQQRQ